MLSSLKLTFILRNYSSNVFHGHFYPVVIEGQFPDPSGMFFLFFYLNAFLSFPNMYPFFLNSEFLILERSVTYDINQS